MRKPDTPWFTRKGFGWGPPANFQGWAFLVAWVALFFAGSHALGGSSLRQLTFVTGMIALLVLVCVVKGEARSGR